MLDFQNPNPINIRRRITVHHCVRSSIIAALALLTIFFGPSSCARAKSGGWDFEPYDVQINIAIDLPGGIAEQLVGQLPLHLKRRIDASLAPAWTCNVHLATGQERAKIFAAIAADDPPLPDLASNKDKLLLATVRTGSDGLELAVREFDRYVQRWSATRRRQSRQESYIPEQLFSLVYHTFSQLARVELDSKDPHRVLLKPRAAALPRGAGSVIVAKVGDVFLPILRRTTRSGELEKKDGVQIVPWTYIEVSEVKGNMIICRIESARRGPIIVRRQGRIEPVAIAIRCDPDSLTLRLHSRTVADKPLVGYEVFSQTPGDETLARVGLTDAAGQISIPPGKMSVQILYVKHGGQLFARIPAMAGLKNFIDISLPDDDARLAAEASLAAVREDLIDVVARRNILISRVRQKIEKKDYGAAQELIRALDDLPGRPQFNLTLANAARSLRSDDPQMQKRIDKLFESTQTLVAQYLDLRPISKLHDDLREAQNKDGTKDTKAAGTTKG